MKWTIFLVLVLTLVGGGFLLRKNTNATPNTKSSPSEVNSNSINFKTISNSDWKKRLTKEQYYILREAGTERAFTGKYHDHKADGTYTCAACGEALFDSTKKYDSGTGWPSFWDVILENVSTKTDYKLIYPRTEVLCSTCDSHLGHVFNDGPKPTQKRYCINSAALNFKAAP